MTGTTRVPRKQLDGVFGAVLQLAMKKMIGSVPEGAEVMWNHKTVFKDTMKFGAKTEKWHELDRTLGTLAAMAAAAEIGCGFCLDLHYFMAHDKGLDETKAQQVPCWRDSDVFTPLERRVMEYAEAMCQTSPTVTDTMSAALLDGLGAAGLVELTAKVGMMNMTARGNVALGIRSAGYAEACGLKPLADPSRPEVPAS